jgi:hypothetical protein
MHDVSVVQNILAEGCGGIPQCGEVWISCRRESQSGIRLREGNAKCRHKKNDL